MSNLMRVALVGALLAGCSKSPRSAPTNGAAGGDATATARHADALAPTPDQKGSTMAPDAIATDYYTQKGWTVAKLVPFERVPYLYRAEFADGIDYVLVHRGKPVDAKGVDALASYLRDVDLLDTAGLDIKDALTLLFVFGAYPPVSGYAEPNGFYDGPEHADLLPKLEVTGKTARIELNYILRQTGNPTAHARLLKVKRWTLAISSDYTLTWREEDVDHNPGAN